MPIFTVVDINENLFEATYPLIRTVAPDVSAKQWSDYARKVRLCGGLLGLAGAEGALFGLVTYRVEECLRRGRFLLIDNFVTFELNRAAPGRHALCNAAEVLAREQGCTAIEVRLDSGGYVDHTTVKAQGWIDLGHTLAAVVFVKFLATKFDAESTAEVLSVVEA